MTTRSSEHAASASQTAGVALTFDTISPPEQGDAVSGLTLAVTGVGPAGAPDLPGAEWPQEIGPRDAWTVAVDAETGWYVLLSQDCDIVRPADDEPTVLVAPLIAVSAEEWSDLRHNAYSARRWAYPSEKLGLGADAWVAVDLAWTTSVIKGSLGASGVRAVRPLTGPNKAAFAEWLAARTGRTPFPDDVVECVLDPFHDVRLRLLKRFDKATSTGGTPPLEARAVGAATGWYARVDGRLVHAIGELSGLSLERAGFLDADGAPVVDELEKAQSRLQVEVVKRMNKVAENSGFEFRVQLVDLATMRASQFREFALLVR